MRISLFPLSLITLSMISCKHRDFQDGATKDMPVSAGMRIQSGSYLFSGNGAVGNIMISQIDGGSAVLAANVVSNAGGNNMGLLRASKVDVTDGGAGLVYQKGKCMITVASVDDETVRVSQSGESFDCGFGHNVNISGTYKFDARKALLAECSSAKDGNLKLNFSFQTFIRDRKLHLTGTASYKSTQITINEKILWVTKRDSIGQRIVYNFVTDGAAAEASEIILVTGGQTSVMDGATAEIVVHNDEIEEVVFHGFERSSRQDRPLTFTSCGQARFSDSSLPMRPK